MEEGGASEDKKRAALRLSMSLIITAEFILPEV